VGKIRKKRSKSDANPKKKKQQRRVLNVEKKNLKNPGKLVRGRQKTGSGPREEITAPVFKVGGGGTLEREEGGEMKPCPGQD